MKDGLGRKIMTKYVAMWSETYSDLKDHSNKNWKGTKMCMIKPKLKFEDYKNCQEANWFENKIKY